MAQVITIKNNVAPAPSPIHLERPRDLLTIASTGLAKSQTMSAMHIAKLSILSKSFTSSRGVRVPFMAEQDMHKSLRGRFVNSLQVKNLLLRILKRGSMRRALIILFVVLAWTGLYVGPALVLLASIMPAYGSVLPRTTV